MLQISKITKSREDWKGKAIQRGYEIREFRKNRKRHLETIAELKRTNRKLMQSADDKKNFSAT
jgi:hypothetical protein